MVARQAPLADLLDFLARAVEIQMPEGTTAAIHLVNTQGTHFTSAAAPSLPPEYVQATVGMAIDSQIGPCCAAAASRETVIVPDVARDPLFPRFAEFALQYGIRAGWSTPILSAAGTVLGTFAVYYSEPRAPRPQDHQLLEILTRTVALAIERGRAHVDRALLAAIVTSSDDAIVSKDLDGVITSWNRGAQRLFGYTAEEAVGRPVTMLIPQDHINEEPKILARIRRGETIDHYETVRRRKDGTLLDISLTVSPLHDAQGSVIGASKVARDITQRRQVEAALQEQAAALADLHRRKDEFLAMLSHELRNPLAPITNALQLLRLQRGSGNPTEEHARTVIERQVGQLKHLVDDLLDVSRITTGKVRLRRERVDLRGDRGPGGGDGPAAHRAAPARAARVGAARAHLAARRRRPAGAGGREPAHQRRQVHRRGRPHLAGRRSTRAARAVLRVRDTGVGIAPELLPRIFDLFTQAERSLDRAEGGLGIGLTLVQAAGGAARRDGGGDERPGTGQRVRRCACPSARRRRPRRPRPLAAAPPATAPAACWSSTTTWTRPRAWPCCWRCPGTTCAPPTTDRPRWKWPSAGGPRWCCWTSACRGSTASRWPGGCADIPLSATWCWSR